MLSAVSEDRYAANPFSLEDAFPFKIDACGGASFLYEGEAVVHRPRCAKKLVYIGHAEERLPKDRGLENRVRRKRARELLKGGSTNDLEPRGAWLKRAVNHV